MTENEQVRVSKREFISRVAHRSGLPVKVVSQLYDAGMAELMDIVTNGNQLMLTGFGRFYPQAHKGHRVQFADSDSKVIADYSVLKFSATRGVNKSLGRIPKPEAEAATVAEEPTADSDLFLEPEETPATPAPVTKKKPRARTSKPKAPAVAPEVEFSESTVKTKTRATRKKAVAAEK